MVDEEAGCILIFTPVNLIGTVIYFIYSFVPSANCKHAVAIALTGHAIYKIYFQINLSASFRKPGQFAQRLDRQVTVFIRLIISIDQTERREAHVPLVLFHSQRVYSRK